MRAAWPRAAAPETQAAQGEDEALRAVVELTINGVSSGLRNTG